MTCDTCGTNPYGCAYRCAKCSDTFCNICMSTSKLCDGCAYDATVANVTDSLRAMRAEDERILPR